jgi:hypothetical protein
MATHFVRLGQQGGHDHHTGVMLMATLRRGVRLGVAESRFSIEHLWECSATSSK